VEIVDEPLAPEEPPTEESEPETASDESGI
jgi:hypothetical protein